MATVKKSVKAVIRVRNVGVISAIMSFHPHRCLWLNELSHCFLRPSLINLARVSVVGSVFAHKVKFPSRVNSRMNVPQAEFQSSSQLVLDSPFLEDILLSQHKD